MSLNWDIFDQAALTGVVNRSLETALEGVTSVSEAIAPRVDVDAREVKVQVRDVHAFGKGQYRAPGATPPLYEPKVSLREEVIELAILSEMHRIKDEDYLALQSSDEGVRRKAGLAIADRGNILAIRNRRLAESLKWEAFSGEAEITYPTGSTITVDYGLPTAHKPVLTAGDRWSQTATADPIADIKEWATLTANAVGHYGLRVHLSSELWELLLENTAIKSKLTGQDRSLLIPQEEDILALLRAGTEFVIVDEGYRDEGVGTDRGVDTLTPYLPKDKVLITTPYVIEGERIADTPTGQVLVSTGYNSVGVRQGPQAEVILEHQSKTHFLRYESALIPRIHHPGAFVYATVT
jgi:hypothetical protein